MHNSNADDVTMNRQERTRLDRYHRTRRHSCIYIHLDLNVYLQFYRASLQYRSTIIEKTRTTVHPTAPQLLKVNSVLPSPYMDRRPLYTYPSSLLPYSYKRDIEASYTERPMRCEKNI